MTAFLPSLLARITILLALGLVIAICLRASSPALRHIVLLATLCGTIALPALMLVSPDWRVALLPPPSNARSTDIGGAANPMNPANLSDAALATLATARQSATTEVAAPVGAIGRTSVPIATPARAFAAVTDLPLIPLLWLTGLIAVLAWLAIGRWRLRHITRTAWPLVDADWKAILDEEKRAADVSRTVRLLSSPAVSTPVTWGWRSPVVLLPEDAPDWPEVHRRIVLRHELAHVARADSLSQLVAGFACALYWFHPLVWMVERRLRAECERACDDTVVSHGTPAAEYAAHLLEVARSARSFGAAGFLSVAMARPSQLEGRLLSVLNESRRRMALSRVARMIALAAAILVLVPLAAFKPVARAEAESASSAHRTAVTKSGHSKTEASKPTTSVAHAKAAKLKKPYHADTTFRLSVPAKSGGTLSLDLRTGGDIVVTSWDRPEIGVRASLAGRDWSRTRVSLKRTATGAELESIFEGPSNNASSHHVFEITIPHDFNIELRSSGGSVSLTGLNGSFSGRTGGGDINISQTTGEADIKTGGGEVHVSNSHLNGSVSTGGGTVRIEGVSGDFKGYSGGGPVIVSKGGGTTVTRAGGVNIIAMGSGSGNGVGATAVSATSSNGAATAGASPGGIVTVSTAGGALSIPSAPSGARITTGGGPITVGPSAGKLYVQTGGGRIDVGPASGSVSASTGAGDVSLELEGATGHTVGVFSGNGNVTLLVPSNLNAELDLETAYTRKLGHKTRIISDFPVQITETEDWDNRAGTPRKYVRVRQAVGRGGPVIRVRTVNGDVVLRRKD